jgi:RNA polymerase sigma-70 factor (ECF subfamily)
MRSLKAYLTTILTRLCIDQLQLARRKREVYVVPWLPEPILTAPMAESGDPEQRFKREESIALAFPILLEQLQAFERAVYLLRESFGYEYAEIESMLGKGEAACRRSFSRARAHLRAHRPRFATARETHRQLLSGYVQAVERGENDDLDEPALRRGDVVGGCGWEAQTDRAASDTRARCGGALQRGNASCTARSIWRWSSSRSWHVSRSTPCALLRATITK